MASSKTTKAQPDVMDILDALAAEDAVRKGPACRTCAYLESLPDGKRDAVKAAIADENRTTASLNRALVKAGQQIDVTKHRRGECKGPHRP